MEKGFKICWTVLLSILNAKILLSYSKLPFFFLFSGRISVWQEKSPNVVQCFFNIPRELWISDMAIHRTGLLLISREGFAFHATHQTRSALNNQVSSEQDLSMKKQHITKNTVSFTLPCIYQLSYISFNKSQKLLVFMEKNFQLVNVWGLCNLHTSKLPNLFYNSTSTYLADEGKIYIPTSTIAFSKKVFLRLYFSFLSEPFRLPSCRTKFSGPLFKVKG